MAEAENLLTLRNHEKGAFMAQFKNSVLSSKISLCNILHYSEPLDSCRTSYYLRKAADPRNSLPWHTLSTVLTSLTTAGLKDIDAFLITHHVPFIYLASADLAPKALRLSPVASVINSKGTPQRRIV